jgi:iron complex outermembrane receptor protein
MRICLLLLFLLFSYLSYSQEDTVQMQAVEISATSIYPYLETGRTLHIIDKEYIEHYHSKDIAALLESIAEIDVRTRGPHGMQADVSLRGGNAEQCLILVNGVKFNDAQTAHHNMNIPVSPDDIDYIEVLQGPAAFVYGANSYAGAINIVTKKPTQNSLYLHLNGGEHSLFGSHISSAFVKNKNSFYLSASHNRSEGYIENTDYINYKLYYRSMHLSKIGVFELQSGYINNAFGANSFYTPLYPDQFEEIQSEFAALQYKTGEKLRFFFTASWRRHRDRFELFREDENYYRHIGDFWISDTDTASFGSNYYYQGHNYHRTEQYLSNFRLAYKTKLGLSYFGMEYNKEKILSNVLGEELEQKIAVKGEESVFYTRSCGRDNYYLFFQHTYNAKKMAFHAGFMGHITNDFTINPYGSLSISYKWKTKNSVFISLTQAMRLPSFTDLYYQGPTNQGNPDLKAEESLSLESGYRFKGKKLKLNASIFRKYGYNTIDWVKENSLDLWQSHNHTDLITNGLQCNVQFSILELLQYDKRNQQLSIGFQYLEMEKESGDLISFYALDHLKSKIHFSIHQEIFKGFFIAGNIYHINRNGSYTAYENMQLVEKDYTDYFLCNLSLDYKHNVKKSGINLKYYVNVHNIFDTKYFDYANIIMPGRWISLGVKADFLFKK